MLWLILLGVATCLVIALRRTRRRQSPLDNELYSKRVAVDHVQSGVAWVREDGTFGSVNESFAKAFHKKPSEFAGREWYKVFGAADHARVRESYSQMMLMGIISFDAMGQRLDESPAWLNVRLVAVHDDHMRFVGHHCMIEDKTREHELEQRVLALEEACAPEQVFNEPRSTESTSIEPTPITPISITSPGRVTGRSVVSILNRARAGARPATRESGSPVRAAG
jgi:PAS domain S-box-containing protein